MTHSTFFFARIFFFLSIAFVGLMQASSASGASVVVSTRDFGSWSLVCTDIEGPQRCLMSQVASKGSEGKNILFGTIVSFDRKDAAPILILRLPSRTYRSSVELSVDNEVELRLETIKCSDATCEFKGRLLQNTLETLSSARVIYVSYGVAPTMMLHSGAILLDGFSEALDALRQEVAS